MDLEDISQEARTMYAGRETVELPGGQRLTIETSPGGAEILDIEIPVGETWHAHINIDIHTTPDPQ